MPIPESEDPITEKEAEKAAMGCGLFFAFLFVLGGFIGSMLGGN